MKQFFFRACSFLLFLQFSFSIQAQDELLKIDSLNQLISNQSGSERMKSLLALSEAYRMVSVDKSIKTGWDALTYADEHGLNSLKASVLRSLGQSAQQAGDFDLAADYYKKAATYFSNLNNREGLARTYNLIGILNLNKSELDTALVYFDRVHTLADELDNDTLRCTAMKNQGQIWFEMGELNKAHDSFYKSSLVFLQLKDTVNYATVYSLVKDEMNIESNLIENVAYRIGRRLFDEIPEISALDIRLMKVNPPFGGDCEGAGIELHLINDKNYLEH